ncbi:MAG: hypothetical protein V5A46_09860 [Haloferacaceae archaeon]
MADVMPAETDRGQLFLVGALGLAVTFLVLALVMNGVIYTENVSARDLGTSTAPVIEYEVEAREVAERLVAGERGGASYDQMEANVTGGLANWSGAAQPFGALGGDVVAIENSTASNGTELNQSPSREFTDEGGTASWVLATDVTTRGAWMVATPSVTVSDIETEGFGNLTHSSGPFHLNVTDGSTTETVFLYENGSGDACVAVFENGSHEADGCVPGGSLRVDLVNGTYEDVSTGDETELRELRVFDRVGEGHDLEFGNGDAADGTYEFVVDAERGSANVNDAGFNDGTGAGSPRAVRALYDVEFDLTYRSGNVRYEATIRIAPGEPEYE